MAAVLEAVQCRFESDRGYQFKTAATTMNSQLLYPSKASYGATSTQPMSISDAPKQSSRDIYKQLEVLHNETIRQLDLLSSLESKLQPVRVNLPGDSCEKCAGDVMTLSPVATEISENIKRVVRVNSIILMLLEEVQL